MVDSESDGYGEAEGHLAKLDQMNWTQSWADAADEANTRATIRPSCLDVKVQRVTEFHRQLQQLKHLLMLKRKRKWAKKLTVCKFALVPHLFPIAVDTSCGNARQVLQSALLCWCTQTNDRQGKSLSGV